MRYLARPGEFPDDVNTRFNETIYRCNHCGVHCGLNWHPTVPGAVTCTRSECGNGIVLRAQESAKRKAALA